MPSTRSPENWGVILPPLRDALRTPLKRNIAYDPAASAGWPILLLSADSRMNSDAILGSHHDVFFRPPLRQL